MTFKEYSDAAIETATVLPSQGEPDFDKQLARYTLGLVAEAAEVGEKVKKYIRGDFGLDELKEKLFLELGDPLWYMNTVCKMLDLDLQEIAQANVDKVLKRKETGTLKGDGDYRHLKSNSNNSPNIMSISSAMIEEEQKEIDSYMTQVRNRFELDCFKVSMRVYEKGMDYETFCYSDYVSNKSPAFKDRVWEYVVEQRQIGELNFIAKYKEYLK